MSLHTQSTSETYYDILNVKEESSFEDIRQSYRSALLQSHPDKLHKPSNLRNSGNDVVDVEDRFVKVKKAWETLSDSGSRALYDHKLRSLRNDIIVADDVALEDMMVEDTGEVPGLCHECRCGDYYMITFSELEEMGFELCKHGDEISLRNPEAKGCVILSCGSCSLRIRLSVNLNDNAFVPSDGAKNG